MCLNICAQEQKKRISAAQTRHATSDQLDAKIEEAQLEKLKLEQESKALRQSLQKEKDKAQQREQMLIRQASQTEVDLEAVRNHLEEKTKEVQQ